METEPVEKNDRSDFTQPITPGESPVTVLEEALASETPRLFGVSAHGIRGRTGHAEEAAIARDLNVMKEGSEAIGEELGMETIGYVAIYDGNSAIAYRYDSTSSPRDPHLIGAMVNKRMPMRKLLKVMGDAV
ncbi:MAG: hypothetical protein L3J39_04035 [Verrucomicrobiales bacterium]|nr:hypothetical protein [Verrucomicrobiales bacterium]